MKQLNLPRKYNVAAQLFISVGLIVLAAIFAFTPILSIDLSDNKAVDALEEVLHDFNESIDSDVDIQIPEKVDVSMPKLLTSVSVFTKVVGVLMDGASSAIDGDTSGTDEAGKELNEILKSEDGQETIVMIMGLLMGTMDTDEADNKANEEEDSTIGAVVNGILSYGILFYLLAVSFVWPIVLIITAIITLIKALKAWKKGENVASKFGAGLIGPFGMVVTTALLLTFVPNLVLGSGMVAILVLCIISIVANIVISRLRSYNELDFKYVNLVQGAGVIKAVGFIVFFANVLNTGFLRSFIDSMSSYLAKALVQVSDINVKLIAARKDTITMNFGYVIDLLLILVAATLALGVCVSVAKEVAAQLGLVAKKKVAKPGSLGTGITALVVCILPIIASKLENKIFYTLKLDGTVETEKAGSIFSISDDAMSALVGMFIGAALILAADIAFKVAKKSLCAGITAEDEELVLTGNAPYVVEGAANETAADEAAAEEAPAEEAVVEETATEEAVVEEAPAEEAPAADEAPVEENKEN